MRLFELFGFLLDLLGFAVRTCLPLRSAEALRRVSRELQLHGSFDSAALGRLWLDRCGNQTDQVRRDFDAAAPNLLLTLVMLGTPKLIELRRIGLPTIIDAFEFVASPQGGAVKHEYRPSSLIIITRQGGPVCGNIGRAGEGQCLSPGSEPKNTTCKNAF